MAPSINDGAKITGLAALSQGTPLPGVPKFTNFKTQREYTVSSKEWQAISVCATPKTPTFFGQTLNEDGVAVGGNMSRPANAAGFLIHSAINRARPDVNVACHFHSTYGKAWSTFAQPLEMLNQDVAIFYGVQSVYKEFGGVVLKEEESTALAGSLGQGKVMILRNHGLLTVGSTVDEAAYLFLLMEKSCMIQLAADAAAASGREKLYVDDEAAQFTYENTSDPESLFAEFQGYLQWESAVSHDGYKAMGCLDKETNEYIVKNSNYPISVNSIQVPLAH
ncbi:hypothetical protein N7449_007957 [Penicillium cf. viridicatum]|uniref:Class II aldolase/adducin N-terminal domain-containing protein n=1 Tax=Penicillium cf. viridicatum TaxID=2972119 RepID=A0A9W9JIH8_9EURO|nr:hypothetical protein N7449_007957 [Penicillium cf. viridicatum]